MALCITVIGKDKSPIYVSIANMDKELELQHKVYVALDAVEEKCESAKKTNPESKDLYLGRLYATESHKVYGYVTNTKAKFIIVIDSDNVALRDNEMRVMFRSLHSIYTDIVCNPFYIPGEPIQSKKFDRCIRKLLSNGPTIIDT